MNPRNPRRSAATWLAMAALAALAAIAPLAADEAKKPAATKPAASTAATAPAKAAAPAKPAMTPEEKQKADMEAMMKAMTPGPQHKMLADRAGSWTYHGRAWMAPGQPPTEFDGTAERMVIDGGRAVQEKVAGAFMQQPYEGMGLEGFDNVTKKFWGTWIDNMSTGPMLSTGTCNDAGTHCDYMAKMSEPASGKVVTSRMTVDRDGMDKEVMKMFDKGPDGKEYLIMELDYTRKK